MANLTTSADVINYILFNGGEPVDGTSDFANAVIEYLNRAYFDMCNGGGSFDPEVNEDWWWLKKDPPGVIVLAPSIELGTVAVTNNSTSITFSSAPPISVAGYFFKTSTHPDVFRVASHTAASTSATLDSVYTGPTGGADVFKLFKTEYTLASDVLRITSPMRVYKNSMAEVDGVELSALERDYPITFIESGTPNQFAMVTESKIRFNRYGEVNDTTKFIRIEYDYLQVPADLVNSGSDTPLVPRTYRGVLADMALYYLLQAKNDDRATIVAGQAKAGLNAMKLDNKHRQVRYSRSFGALQTRQNKTSKSRRPLRTETGFLIG